MVGILKDSVLLKDKYLQPIYPDGRFPKTEWIPDDGWFTFNFDYVAEGGEKFIIIGNFYPDWKTSIKKIRSKKYFPELQVQVDDIMFYSGNDSSPCENQ